MKEQSDSIIKTVPAAEALRKVPQFNPLRYLRRATSRKTGEPVLKFDLRFKKMWFRLACSDGRMVLTPMRITDSMAIFEAQVYLHGDDPKPISNYISTMYAKEIPGGRYIQAAQDEALNEALDNAGFGIQLSDLVEAEGGSGFGSEIPVAQAEHPLAGQPQQPPQDNHDTPARQEKPEVTAHVGTVAKEEQAPAPVGHVPVEPASQADTPAPDQEPAVPQEEPAPPEPEKRPIVAERQNTVSETEDALQMLGAVQSPAPHAPAPAVETPTQGNDAQEQPPETPAYTDDMSIEEITQRMSVDEARSIVVTFGTCKGWTLGEVMDRRASSLRFYLYSAKDAGNVLKAAASLLLNELAMKKAG